MTAWTDHVKAYAKKHSISYKEAMMKAKESYKPKEGEKMEKKEPKEKKERKSKHEKGETKKEEKEEHEMPKGEMQDGKKMKHTQKKRVSSAEALKPKKMLQLM